MGARWIAGVQTRHDRIDLIHVRRISYVLSDDSPPLKYSSLTTSSVLRILVSMELYEAIHGRRSIRQFTPGGVDDAVLRRILRSAMAAPSASNEQPWHFLVIRDAATLTALSESHTYAHMVAHAAAAIIVCADMTLVKHQDYWPHDCAAATQNILLAVHAEGLGSVWVGVYPRESRMAEVRRVIALPEHVHPFCILPVGIPGESKGPEDRFKSTRIHEGQW